MPGPGGPPKKPAATPTAQGTPVKMDGIPAALGPQTAGQMAAQAAEKATAATEAAKATLEQAKNVAQVYFLSLSMLYSLYDRNFTLQPLPVGRSVWTLSF